MSNFLGNKLNIGDFVDTKGLSKIQHKILVRIIMAMCKITNPIWTYPNWIYGHRYLYVGQNSIYGVMIINSECKNQLTPEQIVFMNAPDNMNLLVYMERSDHYQWMEHIKTNMGEIYIVSPASMTIESVSGNHHHWKEEHILFKRENIMNKVTPKLNEMPKLEAGKHAIKTDSGNVYIILENAYGLFGKNITNHDWWLNKKYFRDALEVHTLPNQTEIFEYNSYNEKTLIWKPEKPVVNLTLEQIAKQYNCDVEQIRIKGLL